MTIKSDNKILKNNLNQLENGIVQYQQNNTFCLYDSELVADFTIEMLTSAYWLANEKVLGQAHGRGTTYFVEYEGQQQWVLRHYYRGGLIGKLIHDSYWFTSMAATRAFAEFNLLKVMHQQGLPAPRPVACRVIKHRLSYQADLLTSRIENGQDLVAYLSKQPLSAKLWQEVGAVIARFHQQGIYHHDLNAHNILIDENNKIWLIDFDRGEQRAVKTDWQQGNLSRLLRSFNKELNKLPKFHWQPENWQQLMQGYNS